MNSNRKGKVGERELVNYLKDRGFSGAQRSQQYKGNAESADVVGALDGYHIECKRVESLSLYEAVAQAKRDMGPLDVPLVCHRRNGKEWLAIVPLNEFLELVKRAGVRTA